jgi:hypothetical protein
VAWRDACYAGKEAEQLIENDGRNLAFLFSTPRSGSTLASAILSTHPDVLCPNEPWFLLGLASLWEGGNITHARYEHSSVEIGLREFLSQSEFLEATRSFAISAYNQRLGKENKGIFVDKTPRYFHIIEFVDQLFPRAKKIWLKRNPLDVAVSFQTTWSIPVKDSFDPTYGPLGLDLSLGFHRLSSFFKGQSQTFEFSYEDLVTSPGETIRALCEFMEVKYVDAMERYGADVQGLERRKKLTMGDTKLFAYSDPHRKSVGQWEHSLNAEQVQTILCCLGKALLQRMGYHRIIEQVTRKGFWFPSEATVADNLSVVMNAAKSLPWISR